MNKFKMFKKNGLFWPIIVALNMIMLGLGVILFALFTIVTIVL